MRFVSKNLWPRTVRWKERNHGEKKTFPAIKKTCEEKNTNVFINSYFLSDFGDFPKKSLKATIWRVSLIAIFLISRTGYFMSIGISPQKVEADCDKNEKTSCCKKTFQTAAHRHIPKPTSNHNLRRHPPSCFFSRKTRHRVFL